MNKPACDSQTLGFDAVIFDLDGTLLDTLADLADCCNHAIAQFGVEPIGYERYRYLIGQGVRYLCEHALGPGKAQHTDEAVRLHIERYKDHKYDQSAPYPGIVAMLRELSAMRVKLGILSNKPDAATNEMVAHLLGEFQFDAVWGHRTGYQPKPDPASARALIESLGVSADRVIYVGDTRADMLTGKAAGFTTVGVTWGFRDEAELRQNGADHIIHEPGALISLVQHAGQE